VFTGLELCVDIREEFGFFFGREGDAVFEGFTGEVLGDLLKDRDP
jgi:hypothetical protein